MFEAGWDAVFYLIAIAILVGFHEYGHYWVARRCGVKVLRYSIGFGKVLWSRRAADGVEWCVSAIPLGGYVKMLDEREGPVAPAERHLSFNNATVLRRSLIVAAGPMFNLVLAVAFYWLVFVVGFDGIRPVMARPDVQTAAARAGLLEADEVVSIGGEPVSTWSEMRTQVLTRAFDGRPISLLVRRGDQILNLSMDAGETLDPEMLFDRLGLDLYQPAVAARIGEISVGSAAAAAGFRAGDVLLDHDGVRIENWTQWRTWVMANPGARSVVQVQRGEQKAFIPVTVGSTLVDGNIVGYFGASVEMDAHAYDSMRAHTRLNPLAAVPAAIVRTADMSRVTAKILFLMLRGQVSFRHINGPVNTAQAVGAAAHYGVIPFFSIMALISLSLGIMNLLPVPALDGGHLFYYAIEAMRGAPLPKGMQEAGQHVGIAMLLVLMAVAFYNDLARIFF